MQHLKSIVAVWVLVIGVLGHAACRAGEGPGWAAHATHAATLEHPLSERAARFLAAHAPERDRQLDAELLNENLELALLAREEFAWAGEAPEDVFLNDVLPYATLDETRERWRPSMYAISKQIVKDAESASEAAQLLNQHLFNVIGVHYNTNRERANQSVFESMRQGRATCTGLSIVLVNACRSVGIPARIAGVAEWTTTPGNHTWVEVWDGGAWRFMGADEFDPAGLDRAWFTGRAARAVEGSVDHAVWASSWRRTGRHFPLSWDRADRSVPAVDVTRRYAAEAAPEGERAEGVTRYFRVWDREGGDRVETEVSIVLADGGRLHPLRTRAGRADLNDMPSALLEPGATAYAHVRGDRVAAFVSFEVSGEPSGVIDLYLDRLSLDRTHAEEALAESIASIGRGRRAERAQEIADKSVSVGGHTLRYLQRDAGNDDAGGRPLWVSLHGGGGTTTEVNDRQWKNQIELYDPPAGVYIAPRAPTDTWNLWHQAHVDPLLDRLIENMVLFEGVDPDRVYLLGYSAGGDGVYQLAPRMADRFGAAAMMAGHPNEASPLGLRNLPFAIFMGGDDRAFNRNTVAKKWGTRLGELRAADPSGYEHLVRVYPGLGHWMEGNDAEALPWMLTKTRDAWPERVVWRQDDVVGTRFYWLGVRADEAAQGQTVIAEVRGQSISITADADRGPEHVTLRLCDELVDLDREITVTVNGEAAFEGRVLRSRAAIEYGLAERFDPRSAAAALLEVGLR